MIPLDKLLQPISTENPCGKDPFADGSLRQLEALLQPGLNAEEVQIEPDWRTVEDEALELLADTRDLRVGVTLCLALLKLEGLAGFRDGLALLHGWTSDEFWASVFPLLDPEDQEDPTRVFVFNNLSAPLSTDTPYRFVKYLRLVPLCQPTRLSKYCLRDVLRAREEKRTEESPAEDVPPTPEQIVAAFRDTPQEQLQQTYAQVEALIPAVENLESQVSGKSATGLGPNFGLLKETLDAMRNALSPYLESASAGPDASQPGPTAAAATATTAAAPAFSLGGVIRTRPEAEAALRAASQYFLNHEPSCAAPLLIERALRLSGKNFLESMSELALGSSDEFKKLFGAEPGVVASETSSAAEGKTDGESA